MIEWILAGVAAGLAPLIYKNISRQRLYRELFGDKHLIELAQCLHDAVDDAGTDGKGSQATIFGLAVWYVREGDSATVGFGMAKTALPASAAAFFASYLQHLLATGDQKSWRKSPGRYELVYVPASPAVTPIAVPDAPALQTIRPELADEMQNVGFAAAA